MQQNYREEIKEGGREGGLFHVILVVKLFLIIYEAFCANVHT